MNSPPGASGQAPEILNDIERFTERRFHYRSEIAFLIGQATTPQQKTIFEEIIFLAKFLWNSCNVMRRLGPTGEGYEKLSAEFGDSLEKMNTLLKTLVKDGPGDVKEEFRTQFFAMSHASMENVLRLVEDLSWLKNYSIDTRHPIL